MARQPAVHIGALFKMTRDTLIHVPDLRRQALKVLHLPVAFGTGDFAVNMALVIKQHMLGHIVEFYPRCWRIAVKVFVFLLYPWMLGDNIFMAMQTFFYGRYSGMIGIGHIGVAVLTLDLFDPAVNGVAERYRLLRSNGAIR